MAQVPENPVVVNIMDSYGAILIGEFFACMLWGVSCFQMFLYYYNYENDHTILKVLVGFVWTVNSVDQGLIMKSVFPVLILQWGRVAGLFESQAEYLHHNYLIALVSIGVQQFFLWRIYLFSGKSWYFPVLIQPIVWWQLIGTIPYNVVAMATKDLAEIGAPRQVAISTSYRAAMTFADIAIAATMMFLLLKNPTTVFRGSKQIIGRLLMATINTGTWTAVFALLVLISQYAWEGTLIFCIFENPLGSIYVNTLLANLNARKYIKNGRTEIEWQSANTSTVRTVPLQVLPGRNGIGQDQSVTIHVETSKTLQGDDAFGIKKHGLDHSVV